MAPSRLIVLVSKGFLFASSLLPTIIKFAFIKNIFRKKNFQYIDHKHIKIFALSSSVRMFHHCVTKSRVQYFHQNWPEINIEPNLNELP